MKLSSQEFSILTQCALSAAYQAGHLIHSFQNKRTAINVMKKTAGHTLASQVVTQVDGMAQELILKALKPTCDLFDLALLTEETPDDLQRHQKDFFWCIDPLDGTLPFIEGTTGYAVSIALVSQSGEPQISVIYNPTHQILLHSIKGQGAFYNGKPLVLKKMLKTNATPSPLASTQVLTVIMDRSFSQHPLFKKTMAELKVRALKQGYNQIKTIQQGGAIMNACWVLENAPACYFKFPKPEVGGGSLWDYAATAGLFKEAEVPVSDIRGRELDLNRLDSNFMNHRGILYASEYKIAEMVKELYQSLL